MGKTLTRSMTYAQLVSAISAGTLRKGERITFDFETRHFITDGLVAQALDEAVPAEVTGTTEQLTVLATSANTIDIVVKSTLFPNDIIHYDWNPANWMDNINFVTGETPTLISGFKGVITYREDTIQNNSAGFDFRNCKNRLWSIEQAAWSDTPGTYSEGDIVKHLITGDFNLYKLFIAKTETIATDIPGESTAWEEIWDITNTPYWSLDSTGAYINESLTIPVVDNNDFVDISTFGLHYELVLNCKIGESVLDNDYLEIPSLTQKTFIPSIVLLSNDAVGSYLNNVHIGKSCYNLIIESCTNCFITKSINFIIQNSNEFAISYGQDFSISKCFSFIMRGCGNFSITNCNKFNIESSANFIINRDCSAFNINSSCDSFSIGKNCLSFTIGVECCNFSVGNECNRFTLNNYVGGDETRMIFPDSSTMFSVMDGVRIAVDFTGQASMSGSYNKTISLNNASELIIVYFDSATGQTIVNVTNP